MCDSSGWSASFASCDSNWYCCICSKRRTRFCFRLRSCIHWTNTAHVPRHATDDSREKFMQEITATFHLFSITVTVVCQVNLSLVTVLGMGVRITMIHKFVNRLNLLQCTVSKAPSHGKLISKFMLISSFRKKISSVNSQLSKEINFEILFRNLEHVLFCKISQKKIQLWSFLIGQSASVYKQRTKRRLSSMLAFESLFSMWKCLLSRKILKFLFWNRI